VGSIFQRITPFKKITSEYAANAEKFGIKVNPGFVLLGVKKKLDRQITHAEIMKMEAEQANSQATKKKEATQAFLKAMKDAVEESGKKYNPEHGKYHYGRMVVDGTVNVSIIIDGKRYDVLQAKIDVDSKLAVEYSVLFLQPADMPYVFRAMPWKTASLDGLKAAIKERGLFWMLDWPSEEFHLQTRLPSDVDSLRQSGVEEKGSKGIVALGADKWLLVNKNGKPVLAGKVVDESGAEQIAIYHMPYIFANGNSEKNVKSLNEKGYAIIMKDGHAHLFKPGRPYELEGLQGADARLLAFISRIPIANAEMAEKLL
jgi:hypothetical protein